MKLAGLVLTAMLAIGVISVLEAAESISANPGSTVWNFECQFVRSWMLWTLRSQLMV